MLFLFLSLLSSLICSLIFITVFSYVFLQFSKLYSLFLAPCTLFSCSSHIYESYCIHELGAYKYLLLPPFAKVMISLRLFSNVVIYYIVIILYDWSLYLCNFGKRYFSLSLSLVLIMSWCWPGNKPLSEPMVVKLLMHSLNEFIMCYCVHHLHYLWLMLRFVLGTVNYTNSVLNIRAECYSAMPFETNLLCQKSISLVTS